MAAEVDSVDVVTSNKSSDRGTHSSRKGGQSTGRYSNTKNFIAGGVGGVVVVALGHPFDTIKVRLQTQSVPPTGEKKVFTGTYDCFRKTVRNEGFRGLYKGVLAPLTVITPLYALSFYGYGLGKQLLLGSSAKEPSVIQNLLAGGFSGFFTTIVSAPGERVKCLMQIQRESKTTAKYSSSVNCAVRLYKEGGVRNVYKGTFATLLRDVSSGAVYFGIYYWLLDVLRSPNTSRDQLNVVSILLAGGAAGIACSVASLPPDVVKSRIQTAPEGTRVNFMSTFSKLVREGGIRAFYKGLAPVTIRAGIGNSGAFLGYEYAIKFLNEKWK